MGKIISSQEDYKKDAAFDPNDYLFDFSDADQLRFDQVVSRLVKQSMAGTGVEPPSRNKGHNAAMSIAVSTFISLLAFQMHKHNDGEWDQEVFSEIGEELRDGIREVLARYREEKSPHGPH